MKTTIVFIYASLLAIGGIIGYLKAGSLASLLMGLSFSAAFILCGYASLQHKRWSASATLALMALLACFFAWRLAITLQIMPAGAMLAVTLLAMFTQVSCCCKGQVSKKGNCPTP